MQRLKFNSISLTDKNLVDKENSIWERKVQNQMFWTQLYVIEGLIEFIKGFIARKFDF
jgi:hypothetical protein